MLNKALGLAERGFRVFPVHSDHSAAQYNKWKEKNGKLKRLSTAKDAAIKEWPQRATTDITQIKRWWRQNPTANIGIVPGPDFIVFDVDPRHAGWRESLKKLRALGLPLSTMTVKTPGGGFHLYYRHPRGGVIKASDANWKAQFPGIDIRADNAYVLAPGSTINGKKYKEVEK